MYDKLRELGLSPEHADDLAGKLAVLTDRENEIFFAWASGATYREVGRQFGTSKNSVKRIVDIISVGQGGQKVVLYSGDQRKHNEKKRRLRRTRKTDKVKIMEMKNRRSIFEYYENNLKRIELNRYINKTYNRYKIVLVDNCIDRDDFRQEMWCQLFERTPRDCQTSSILSMLFSNAKNYSKNLRRPSIKIDPYQNYELYEDLGNGNYMRNKTPNYDNFGA